MRRPVRLRTRLTLWYTLALAVILVIYGVVVHTFVRRELLDQLDDQLQGDATAVDALLQHVDGRVVPPAGGLPAGIDAREGWVEVWSPAAELLLRLGDAETPAIGPGPWGADATVSVIRPDGRWRVHRRSCRVDDLPVVLVTVRSEAELHEELRELVGAMLLGLPLALLLAAVGGAVLAGRLLAPLRSMASQAERISAEALSERFEVARNDELGRLATVFNDTFGRLERSFSELRRFVADASHELRTPLAALRSTGEVALAGDGGRVDLREAIGSMLEETDRLSQLVQQLLVLSRADSGAPVTREAVDLSEVAAEIVERLAVLADERGQRLSLDPVDGPVVSGDRQFLALALLNLVENAICHGNPDGVVRIEVAATAEEVHVVVRDDGPGIAPELAERVFERFYRTDASRSRATGGHGLGLSIARRIVEAHGGRIELRSVVGEGSEFTVVLPRADSRSEPGSR